jgi:hypothetical protein
LQKAAQPEKLRYFDLLESSKDSGDSLSYPRRLHEEEDVGACAELDLVELELVLDLTDEVEDVLVDNVDRVDEDMVAPIQDRS